MLSLIEQSEIYPSFVPYLANQEYSNVKLGSDRGYENDKNTTQRKRTRQKNDSKNKDNNWGLKETKMEKIQVLSWVNTSTRHKLKEDHILSLNTN